LVTSADSHCLQTTTKAMKERMYQDPSDDVTFLHPPISDRLSAALPASASHQSVSTYHLCVILLEKRTSGSLCKNGGTRPWRTTDRALCIYFLGLRTCIRMFSYILTNYDLQPVSTYIYVHIVCTYVLLE
jgi:hypothetical protein